MGKKRAWLRDLVELYELFEEEYFEKRGEYPIEDFRYFIAWLKEEIFKTKGK